MKIIYKTGNLLEAIEPAILHGCNSCGVMNSGVAKAIREKYPQAYEKYMEIYNRFYKLELGTVQLCRVNDVHIEYVCNAIVQKNYGNDGKRYVNYIALAQALQDVDEMSWNFQWKAVAMPKIGAGLGGGDWNIISELIEDAFTDVQPVVYIPETRFGPSTMLGRNHGWNAKFVNEEVGRILDFAA